MKYKGTICTGVFIARPNRFIAHVMVEDALVIAHVKNTGRCRELLVEGALVILEHSLNPGRKTDYSLIAVYKGDLLINIDSQAPNAVVKEGLTEGIIEGFENLTLIKAESTYKSSRFDFYVETLHRKSFIEVKGATLEEDGVVRFPDAPTERGKKHIEELIDAHLHGFHAMIIFVIQMSEAKWFEPNVKMDPGFFETLRRAADAGVEVKAYTCSVDQGGLRLLSSLPVKLG